MLNIKVFCTGVFVDLPQLLIIDNQYDLLLAEFAELHALLNQISLSLTLCIIPMNIILYEAVSLLGSLGFGIDGHVRFRQRANFILEFINNEIKM